MSDQSPPRKAFGRPPNLDLERCPPIDLGPTRSAHPEYSAWALIYDPHPLTPRWWLTFLPFVVITTHRDGLIEVRNPDKSIGRYRSPGAVEGDRKYLQIPKEEAEALARQYGVDLPPGLFPATPEGIEAARLADKPSTSESLSDQIRRKWPRRKLQAALVKYMEDRESASYLEIAKGVHGDDLTDRGAIEQLVMRTNDTLTELHVTITYRYGAEHVYKEVAPE
jgi:hypothetical protein